MRRMFRPGVTTLLWLAFAGLVTTAWSLAFAACAVTVPGLARDACPRPIERAGLLQAQAAHAALQVRLASLRRDMAERGACPPSVPATPRRTGRGP